MFIMGTITANIDDDTEQLFREAVKETLGEGKGKLGKAMTEALGNWAKEKSQQEARKKLLEKMKTGLYNLGDYKFNREELYDRF
jgi:hypothetical protein